MATFHKTATITTSILAKAEPLKDILLIPPIGDVVFDNAFAGAVVRLPLGLRDI